MIRGFRAISRAVATVAVSVGLVCAATTGASATTAIEDDAPAVQQIAQSDPVPDVPVDTPVSDVPIDAPVPDVPVPGVPELPSTGLLDGLLAALGNLLSSLLGGAPVPLPVPVPAV